MTQPSVIADNTAEGFWIDDSLHRAGLKAEARGLFDFYRASVRPEGGFYVLGDDGRALPDTVQELHTTTRMIHSFALGHLAGVPGCDAVIDHGMRYLQDFHFDPQYGGFVWSVDGDAVADGRKLAYGHVFVLLAAASAKAAGHPDADALLAQAADVLDQRFREADHGRLADEWARDWTPFSTYRGMNANMHGVEGLLAAYEATGETVFLTRASGILDFFLRDIAAVNGWRVPEHYTDGWAVDRGYAGDPMFRPAGTTPGHSFELARLMLQCWDLRGRPNDGSVAVARHLTETALADGWDAERGGIVYTLDFSGKPDVQSRFWWPVTEAIGVLVSLIKVERDPKDEVWYRRMWEFADKAFIDHTHGGWLPQAQDDGTAERVFRGKPDIYHALQAVLFPLVPDVSRQTAAMRHLGLG